MQEIPSQEIDTIEHCLKQERWQGPPNVKQYEIVLSFWG